MEQFETIKGPSPSIAPVCLRTRCEKHDRASYFRMCQAIGELQVAGFRFAPCYWGSPISGIAICRALRCVKLLGFTMCRVLLCVKLLGNYNLHVFALCGLQFMMYLTHARHVTRPVHHISSCGDSGSSYIFNTPFPFIIIYLEHAPHVGIPVHHIP